MRTDKKQCLSMKTVLTVGRTQMTSGHATVCVARVEKKDTKDLVVYAKLFSKFEADKNFTAAR